MQPLLRALALVLPLAPLPALAHATLEVTQAPAGSTYKGTIRVGHGCEGSPTRRVTVTIPEGVIEAKPMPKAGWTLTTETAPYAKPYDYYGRAVERGVRTITWTGNELPDDRYDEFVFRAYLTKGLQPAGGTVWFPIVQECVQGAHSWTAIPAPGQDAHALKEPAPGVRLVAAGGAPAAENHAGHGATTTAQAAQPAPVPAAAEVRVGDLAVERAWTRATPGGASVAGGYVTVRNTGTRPDRLIGGTFAAAGRAEVHEMATKDGVMTMREVPGGIEIAPGATVELKPGGLHMMFTGLTRPVREGEAVRGTLVFERAGTVEVEFRAEGLAARAPGGHAH